MALIDKSAFESDLSEGQMRLRQEVLGAKKPLSNEPAVRRDAGGVGEGPDEMTHRQAACTSEIGYHDGFIEMRAHDVLRQALLPRCQARSGGRIGCPAPTPSGLRQKRRRTLVSPRDAYVDSLAGLHPRLAAIATPEGHWAGYGRGTRSECRSQ